MHASEYLVFGSLFDTRKQFLSPWLSHFDMSSAAVVGQTSQ